MKFICDQQVLARALNTVSKAVSVRTTIPILKGILIEAREGKLTLSASDLEISIRKEVEAKVIEDGSAVVGAKLFGDIIRKLPPEEILIEEENETSLLIRTASSQFTVLTMATEEFPSLGEGGDYSQTLVLDTFTFREMVRKTSFAASLDEGKGALVGILTELTPESIEMAALDGFRLAHTRMEMVGEGSSQFIIAAKIMNELSKIVADETEADTLRFSLGEKRALAEIGSTSVTIRIMEGDFIRYRDIMPKENTTQVRVSKTLLLESIERASLLAREGKNNLIKMSINEDLLTITSRSEEGNVREEIGVEKEGNNIDIGFNSKFVIDVLKAIDDEEILLLLKNSISPCLVAPVEGREYEYLVLPVRIPAM